IAQDAADARGRTLVGLDGRGVVVALDAEGHRDAVAGIDHPPVFPRAPQTAGPSGGRRRRCSRLDLYEQCSDHITAYIASSRWLGARPSSRAMSAASPSVSPRARWSGSAGGPRPPEAA